MNNFNALGNQLRGTMQNAVGTMKQMGEMANQIEQVEKIVALIKNGGNPMELLNSFASQNPQAKQMMGNLQGKSPNEMRAYAENMAKSYGTDLETVARQLGLTLPK